MKKRITIYTNVDITQVALLQKYFLQEGIATASKSNLIAQAVDVLCDFLVKSGQVTPPEGLDKVIELVQSIGGTSPTGGVTSLASWWEKSSTTDIDDLLKEVTK